MSFIIRQAIPEDIPFITSSWINSYYDSQFAQEMKRPLYLRCQAQVVHYLMQKPSVALFVAASDDLIYGYAAYEKDSPNKLVGLPVFHYIYVKRTFNHFGICEKLLEAAPFPFTRNKVIGTHMTYKGEKLFRKLGLIYCPYMI